MRKSAKLLFLLLIFALLIVNLAVVFSPVSARPPQWFIDENPYGMWYNNGGTWVCFGCAPQGNCMCPW